MHIPSLILTAVVLFFYFFGNYIKTKKFPTSLVFSLHPIFSIIFLTFLAHITGFVEKYKIKVAGEVSFQFEKPRLPNFALISPVLISASVKVALVMYGDNLVEQEISEESGLRDQCYI